MRFKALLLSLIIIFAGSFVGCKQNNVTSDNNVFSQNSSSNISDVEILDNTAIYNQFINGEITAKTDEGYFLYVNQYDYLDKGFSYAFCDVDSDNVDELCVKNLQLYIFDVKDGGLYNLYTETLADSTVLNDGGLFQVKYGAEPDHIYYDYKKINQNGEIDKQLYFSWWDAATADDTESYYIGENSVTKQEYEELWAEYSNFADDKVIWTTVESKSESTTSQNTQAEKIDIYTELDNTINIPYENALKEAWSTAEICDVHSLYSEKWQSVSTKYYNELIKDEKLKIHIIKLKNDWETYYTSQIESYRNIYGVVYEGGSLTGIILCSRERELQKEWAMQLVNIYEHS